MLLLSVENKRKFCALFIIILVFLVWSGLQIHLAAGESVTPEKQETPQKPVKQIVCVNLFVFLAFLVSSGLQIQLAAGKSNMKGKVLGLAQSRIISIYNSIIIKHERT